MKSNKSRRGLLIVGIGVSVLFLLVCEAFSATYYIDNNAANDSANGTSKSTPWKRCPGMYGFAGTYTHSAGDIFVFKGGVTWTRTAGTDLLVIANSGGGTGTEDQYTVDKTWYVGDAWDYPVFSGGNPSDMAPTLIMSTNKSNLIIEYIKFINLGSSADGSGETIAHVGGSNIHVRYNYISPNAVDAWVYAGSGTTDHIYFHDNIIRQCGRVTVGAGAESISYLYMYNNVMEGGWDYNARAYHSDGFMIQGANPSDYAIKYLYVYNNKFWGDWGTGATAQIFLSGDWGTTKSIQHAYIYNNLLTVSNTTDLGSTWLMGIASEVGLTDDLYIFNNTIDYSTSNDPPTMCIFYGSGTKGASGISNVTVKNNILKGCRYGIYADTVNGNNVIGNNIFSVRGTNPQLIIVNSASYADIASAQAAGYGTSSSTSDPAFVSNPVGANGGSGSYGLNNGNWHLKSTSPAKGAGANLSSYFTIDLDGNTRSGAWDIGAYAYGEGQGALAPPSNLRIAQ